MGGDEAATDVIALGADLVVELGGRVSASSGTLGEEVEPPCRVGEVEGHDDLGDVVPCAGHTSVRVAVDPSAGTGKDGALATGTDGAWTLLGDVGVERSDHGVQVVFQRGNVVVLAGFAADDPFGLGGFAETEFHQPLMGLGSTGELPQTAGFVAGDDLPDDGEQLGVEVLGFIDDELIAGKSSDAVDVGPGEREEEDGLIGERPLQDALFCVAVDDQVAQRGFHQETADVVAGKASDQFVPGSEEERVEVGLEDGEQDALGRDARALGRLAGSQDDGLLGHGHIEQGSERVVILDGIRLAPQMEESSQEGDQGGNATFPCLLRDVLEPCAEAVVLMRGGRGRRLGHDVSCTILWGPRGHRTIWSVAALGPRHAWAGRSR